MPLNIDIQQIFLHLFNFIILGGGLYLLLYKPVKDFMNKRVEYYQKMEDDAKNTLQQAEDKKAEYEEKINKAQLEIDDMKSQAEKEAEVMAEAQVKSARNEAEQIIKVAKINSEREKQKAIEAAKEEITQIAIDATRKLMMTQEDPYQLFVESTEQENEDESHDA